MAGSSQHQKPKTPLYVAFDLDNTLGFFEITNKLAYLWSPEMVNNPEQKRVNRGAEPLSPRLLPLLSRARTLFAEKLLEDEHLLSQVLRSNLDALIDPLLEQKRSGVPLVVVIYSNTGVSYSLELAKCLIEKRYKAPGFFSTLADHWSPLRGEDRTLDPHPLEYVEPLKTMGTLQKLFRAGAAGSHRLPSQIPATQILFVDDRKVKHHLKEEEPKGLTYLVPESFYPFIPAKDKKEYILLALEALDEVGLLEDQEYMTSAFCQRKIPYEFTKTHTINGFEDLLRFIVEEMESVKGGEHVPSKGSARRQRALEEAQDTYHIHEVMQGYLEQAKGS